MIKQYFIVFATVFVAELGDKTQIAAFLFAAREPSSPMMVFAAASLALVVATGLGVYAGSTVADMVNPRYLSLAAGVAFVGIGVFTIWRALAAPVN